MRFCWYPRQRTLDRPDYPGKIVPLRLIFELTKEDATVEFQRVDGDVGEITLNLVRFDDLVI